MPGVPRDGSPTYRLHDLMRDERFAWLRRPSTRREKTICPAWGSTLTEAHPRFLDRYRIGTPPAPWHEVADDGYLYDHLIWHLEKSGRSEEIHELLWAEDAAGKNGWYETRERLGQTSGYLTDLEGRGAWPMRISWRSLSARDDPAGPLCTNSGVVEQPGRGIPEELLEQLVDHGVWTVGAALTYARCIPDDSQGVRARVALLDDSIPVHGERSCARPWRRPGVSATRRPAPRPCLCWRRTWTRRRGGRSWRGPGGGAGIAMRRPAGPCRAGAPTWTRAGDAARGPRGGAGHRDGCPAPGPAALAPHLDEATRPAVVREALEAARRIGERRPAPRPWPRRCPTWTRRTAARGPGGGAGHRGRVAAPRPWPRWPPPGRGGAAGGRARGPGGGAGHRAVTARAEALRRWRPHLDEAARPTVVREALEAARGIGDAPARARALSALAPHLDEATRPRSCARPSRRRGASGMSRPAPRPCRAGAPPGRGDAAAVVREALEAARGIGDGPARAAALAAPAPHLGRGDAARGPRGGAGHRGWVSRAGLLSGVDTVHSG